MVVDFPAPLGPKKPTMLPFSMVKETSSKTCCVAYRLDKWEICKLTVFNIGCYANNLVKITKILICTNSFMQI